MKQLFLKTVQNQVPKIIGLGFNYGQPHPKPVFFQKSSNCLTQKTELSFPQELTILHELELGIFIGKGGKQISQQDAYNHIGGYFLCLDLTDISLLELREKQYPWELSKSLDDFLPVSRFIEKDEIQDPMKLELKLFINEKHIYDQNTSGMCYNIQQQIEYVSKYITLNPGDLILTGTPKGGKIQRNSLVHGQLFQNSTLLDEIKVTIK